MTKKKLSGIILLETLVDEAFDFGGPLSVDTMDYLSEIRHRAQDYVDDEGEFTVPTQEQWVASGRPKTHMTDPPPRRTLLTPKFEGVDP